MKSIVIGLMFHVFAVSCYGQLATPGAAGLRFGHVHLNVSDVDAHVRLWTTYFGGEQIQIESMTAIKFANVVVVLNPQIPTLGSRETVMDHFGFKVRNIDTFLASWREAKLEAGDVFTGAEGQSNAYVMLPDGVYVELQEDQGLSQEVTGYHVHLYTPNPQELLDWYSSILEIEIKPRGSISTTTNVPGQNLSFARSNEPRKPTQGSSIDHIGFEVNDLPRFVSDLEAKGVVFHQPMQRLPNSQIKSVFFTDPAGTLIELTEGLEHY
ncbi:MAG: catechol 2,3-dioxygenase-like lactoylglutathione lyase family enzyme [Pseudohongiellaceae bacterium]|jgi:catechol 2,3-dioxygenase-like lactoylglutathione lyase family enzyme